MCACAMGSFRAAAAGVATGARGQAAARPPPMRVAGPVGSRCCREGGRLARLRAAAAAAASDPSGASTSGRPAEGKKEQLPMQQKVLNAILSMSSVPYRCAHMRGAAPAPAAGSPPPLPPLSSPGSRRRLSRALSFSTAADDLITRITFSSSALHSSHHHPPLSRRSSFVPAPATFLHGVDARIKQLWLVCLYVLVARSAPPVRLGIAAGVAAVTAATLPPRLAVSQLARLGALCAVIFLFTAIGSDGIPPVLQPRAPPPELGGLPPCPPPEAGGYSYVLAHLGIVTITRRSVNLALTAATLTFAALQSASLVLVTTPGEEMAAALSAWLAPLRLLRVPTREIALTLLLSLRFMSLVFEEVRNMALGLAARGVDWKAQGGRGSLDILGRLVARLFGALFYRSEAIAQAMVVRGFAGPEAHALHMARVNAPSIVANVVALGALAALFAASYYIR